MFIAMNMYMISWCNIYSDDICLLLLLGNGNQGKGQGHGSHGNGHGFGHYILDNDTVEFSDHPGHRIGQGHSRGKGQGHWGEYYYIVLILRKQKNCCNW